MLISKKETTWFSAFAHHAAMWAGKPVAFASAAGILILWAISGPVFGFSDTWQLIINTGTTIVTFLMVFIIQNSQNRDAEAIHVKLDELIRATFGAQNKLLDLEELAQDEIEDVRREYSRLAAEARDGGGSGTDCPKAPA
jgi:low affinity Fe/Cu permease